jgi:hypothetical protein
MSFAWYNMTQTNQTTMPTKTETFSFPQGENARDNNKGEEKGAASMMVEILPLLRLALEGGEGEPALENFKANLILRAHGPLLGALLAPFKCVAFAFRLRRHAASRQIKSAATGNCKPRRR